jgi:hypothetical protein
MESTTTEAAIVMSTKTTQTDFESATSRVDPRYCSVQVSWMFIHLEILLNTKSVILYSFPAAMTSYRSSVNTWVVSDCIPHIRLHRLPFDYIISQPRIIVPQRQMQTGVSGPLNAFKKWIEAVGRHNVPNMATIRKYGRKPEQVESKESFYGFRLTELVRTNSIEKEVPTEIYDSDENGTSTAAQLPTTVRYFVYMPDYCVTGANLEGDTDRRQSHDTFAECSGEDFHESMQQVPHAYLEVRCGGPNATGVHRWRAELYQPASRQSQADVEANVTGEMDIEEVGQQPRPAKAQGSKKRKEFGSPKGTQNTEDPHADKRRRLSRDHRRDFHQRSDESRSSKAPGYSEADIEEHEALSLKISAWDRLLAMRRGYRKSNHQGGLAKPDKEAAAESQTLPSRLSQTSGQEQEEPVEMYEDGLAEAFHSHGHESAQAYATQLPQPSQSHQQSSQPDQNQEDTPRESSQNTKASETQTQAAEGEDGEQTSQKEDTQTAENVASSDSDTDSTLSSSLDSEELRELGEGTEKWDGAQRKIGRRMKRWEDL